MVKYIIGTISNMDTPLDDKISGRFHCPRGG
ncbi:hypothetical protein [Anaerostipes caccae]